MKTQVCVFNKKSHPGEETDLNVLKPEQTLIKGPPEETDDPIVTQVPSLVPNQETAPTTAESHLGHLNEGPRLLSSPCSATPALNRSEATCSGL